MSNTDRREEKQQGPDASAAAVRRSDSLLIQEPTLNDIILGRGSSHAWRSGNARFHQVLDQCMPRYLSARTKIEKRRLIHEVYDLIRERSGRFLEKDEANDGYLEIDEDEALVKIGYAIRYRKKRIRKAISDDMETGEATTAATIAQHSNEMAVNDLGHKLRWITGRSSISSSSTPSPLSTLEAAESSAAADIDIISDEALRSVLDPINDEHAPPPKSPKERRSS